MFFGSHEYGIVVGYDGSAGSMRALRWGALTAQSWAVPLTVCHVWSCKPIRLPGETVPAKLSYDTAVRVLARGVARAEKTLARGQAQKLLLTGAPETELCTLTGQALMTVVGAQGFGGQQEALGPVSRYLATHADGPVVVLPPEARPPCAHQPASVVVGTDGSHESDAALGFAFAQANAMYVPLHVVCCWADLAPEPVRTPLADVENAQDAAYCLLEEALQPYRDRYPHVTVRTEVTGQIPVLALLEATSCAQLLVVSARLAERRAGTDVGAVAPAVLARARCPVVIEPRRYDGLAEVTTFRRSA